MKIRTCHDVIQTVVDKWSEWDEETKGLVALLLAGDKAIEPPIMHCTVPSIQAENATEIIQKIAEQLSKHRFQWRGV